MTEELKKKVWAFSLPMISELFVQQLYSIIDIAIIGRYLGAKELGAVGNAVGNAANIIMLFLVASGGFEMAVDVMVSRLFGIAFSRSSCLPTETWWSWIQMIWSSWLKQSTRWVISKMAWPCRLFLQATSPVIPMISLAEAVKLISLTAVSG